LFDTQAGFGGWMDGMVGGGMGLKTWFKELLSAVKQCSLNNIFLQKALSNVFLLQKQMSRLSQSKGIF
jgi:hypothetical protein